MSDKGFISFDPEEHKYTYQPADLKGFALPAFELPSVTTIIKDAGLGQDFSMIKGELDWYGDRGTKIHKACHLHDMNNLDEDSLHDEIRGYLESYRKFKEVYKLHVAASEQIVYDIQMGYAGTLDKAGGWTVNRRRRKILLDLKSGSPHPSHGIQIAAYRMSWIHIQDEFDYPPEARGWYLVGVYLKKDGGLATIEDYTKEAAYYESVFRAALTCYNARRRIHG